VVRVIYTSGYSFIVSAHPPLIGLFPSVQVDIVLEVAVIAGVQKLSRVAIVLVGKPPEALHFGFSYKQAATTGALAVSIYLD
jgi:hypothetical protein